MRGLIKEKRIFFFFIIANFVTGQDVVTEKGGEVCKYCTCSEIPNEDATHLVLNIQCSELDRIESLPDLEKIEWPPNPNGLKISATFESLELSTLGKLPPNAQVESLLFTNNAIKTYWPDPFSDVPNLKKLSFSQNELASLTPDLFTGVRNLLELDLSYNKLEDINPLDFKLLRSVKRFNLQGNSIKKVPLEALQPMTALEDLDLSKNGIYDLLLRRQNDEALKGLKRLNLNGNRIRSVMVDSFPENNSLELLDLSSNIIEIVEEDAFLSCPNLRELNLAQNNITVIFQLPPSLQIFILKQNSLFRWPKFPIGITYIDLSYNKLTDLYDDQSAQFDNLEVLNLAGNQLKELNIQSKLVKIFNLDVSYNQLQEIPQSLNSLMLPNIEELRLDGNPITNIYFKDILAVKRLYMNDMSSLYKVEDKAFSNVIGKENLNSPACFSLYLSSCHSLSEISEGAFDGTNVCLLDLSNNNLTHLPRDLLDWSTVRDGVDLQRNPWDCSCHLQWILETLLPSLYRTHSRLLAQLRCESPAAVQGLRMVHWYNWTGQVLCGDSIVGGSHGSYRMEQETKSVWDFLTNPSPLTLILGACIIVSLLIALALTVYLIKGRKRYQARQAAMKRKRQSAIDIRKSNGHEKEQATVLNKV